MSTAQERNKAARAKIRRELEAEKQAEREIKERTTVVKRLQESGHTPDQIAAVTQFPQVQVNKICEDQKIALAHAKYNYEQKVPVLKNIYGLGLDALNERMQELLDPDVRKKALAKFTDLKQLLDILERVHEMLNPVDKRNNINIQNNITTPTGEGDSYQKTRETISALRSVDPVFEYPQLPEPPAKSKEELEKDLEEIGAEECF